MTTAITGAVRISTVFDQYAHTARKIPRSTARRNPVTMRTKLNPTDCQKFPLKISSKSFRTTETGDARRISCFRYILANCQIAIQKSTANMRIPVYFVPLSVFALSFVIECIIRQLSSYNLRILIIQGCQIS